MDELTIHALEKLRTELEAELFRARPYYYAGDYQMDGLIVGTAWKEWERKRKIVLSRPPIVSCAVELSSSPADASLERF